MEDLMETNSPLNAYAKVFFGLWILVALVLAGFQSADFSSKQPAESQRAVVQTAQAIQPKQASFTATNRLSSSNRFTSNQVNIVTQ